LRGAPCAQLRTGRNAAGLAIVDGRHLGHLRTA
jgi:hypothetical protein